MTREEAIKYLSEEQKKTKEVVALTERDFGASESVWHKEYEAFNLAISDLREQEERSKGCEYCTEYKELPEHCLNDGQDVGRIFDTCILETNQGWHIELPTSFDIGIRFCPMCGRRLEEV